ncbi:hypothetical protein BUALT_Bualt02G0071100 [Buddleja alternifolia]|uniref:Glycosyl transferase CAP10 domain-containing protein n=1 Tax=Buddleja alternifolia TaxID=168488 RepID=A0AAV6Y4V9_9LAMI|nr:hypothetical protein BUALT_Bualt02G0071100 [Buddleja alternifolia]
MEAQKLAAFRVVIIGGKLYVDFYYACVQSRAMFTIWGFLQLLRRYSGKIPDVDLMFDCMDKPTVNRTQHSSMPLPLFRYCTTSQHFDIPFPDWSFWGWSEINIGPWDEEFESIKQGSKRRNWARKLPIAYWKGNPDVASPIRMELLQCNDTNLWRAQIMRQDWEEEARGGFKDSKLSKQCDHRRGLIPNKNYWRIPPSNMCESIKSAVDWGNSHPFEAEELGTAAQNFMGSLSMDRVYDYMYHLLTEYSKLQAFMPLRPSSALEVCVDSVLCFADQKKRRWLKRSTTFPSPTPPCSLPLLDKH